MAVTVGNEVARIVSSMVASHLPESSGVFSRGDDGRRSMTPGGGMIEGSSRTNGMGTVTAAAATLTAVVAVVVAIWDNVETRKHNRLSVLPYVVLEHVRNDSGPVTRAEVVMSNAGVGPAMLRGLEIVFPEEDGEDAVASAWGAVAPLIMRRGVQIRGWADVDSSTALGVQEQQALLRIQAVGEGSGDRVQEVLDRLRLRLRYTSVYGDLKESTLGWRAGR